MKTGCYGRVQQAHPLKSTENFDFNLQKARIFSSKARITREDFKPYWTTKEVSVLILIVLDSFRGAINMSRSAVMRLHFEFWRYWILSKTVCKWLESFSFGSKECGNTFIYLN